LGSLAIPHRAPSRHSWTRSSPIVALGEGIHSNEQAHAFRLALIRDPHFTVIVDDIVVEFGTRCYRSMIDAFIRGETVPVEELRKTWRDTMKAGPIWDVLIYEEFFRAVRAVNAGLPQDRRLRVLLTDPPIEWENVHTPQNWIAWNSRGVVAVANLVRSEVPPRFQVFATPLRMQMISSLARGASVPRTSFARG